MNRVYGPVSRWVIGQQRRSLASWALALAAVSAMYMAFYPSMANEDMEALMAGLPEALRQGMGWDAIATGAGYLESTVYGLLAPVLLLVFAIGWAARLLAGEEESGNLELESSSALARSAIYWQRLAALVCGIVVLVAALGVVTLILAPMLEMGIPPGNIVAATVGLGLLIVALATLTFAVGASTGSRSQAAVMGSVVAVTSYIANALSSMIAGADWLALASPFGWYTDGQPLLNGYQPAGMMALISLTGIAAFVGLAIYQRRDLAG